MLRDARVHWPVLEEPTPPVEDAQPRDETPASTPQYTQIYIGKDGNSYLSQNLDSPMTRVFGPRGVSVTDDTLRDQSLSPGAQSVSVLQDVPPAQHDQSSTPVVQSIGVLQDVPAAQHDQSPSPVASAQKAAVPSQLDPEVRDIPGVQVSHQKK